MVNLIFNVCAGLTVIIALVWIFAIGLDIIELVKELHKKGEK